MLEKAQGSSECEFVREPTLLDFTVLGARFILVTEEK